MIKFPGEEIFQDDYSFQERIIHPGEENIQERTFHPGKKLHPGEEIFQDDYSFQEKKYSRMIFIPGENITSRKNITSRMIKFPGKETFQEKKHSRKRKHPGKNIIVALNQ